MKTPLRRLRFLLPLLAAPLLLGLGADEIPSWGRGRFQPTAATPLVATADGCALCHSASPRATALRTELGDDASPHGLWQGTMMANAFVDPFWRAQVAREIAAHPDAAAEIQALCLRCHAPMRHHEARRHGEEPDSIAALVDDPLARDGVSCTICHQVRPEGLGSDASFDGRLDLRPERRIYGPYPEPAGGPMRMHSAYAPEHGPHVQESALCGTCHTLRTTPHGIAGASTFVEQSPYLEWRNSAYSDEEGRTESSRRCTECHMPDLGSMRIARNPGGRDFNIQVRPEVRGHAFVGGNAFMLDLLAANRAELGVSASREQLERGAAATRAQLAQRTATIAIAPPRRTGAVLEFAVHVENHAGHKLPSGYPARRAWLEVAVQAGGSTVFHSGRPDAEGRIGGAVDELAFPHVDLVERPEQVPVYELVAHDAAGRPTTLLTEMATRAKDSRLLPRGWRSDGPHAEETMPVGIGDDDDFVGGGDVVHYRIALPPDAGPATVVAQLRYQAIPPSWVAPLRRTTRADAVRFARLYDAMPQEPETLAVDVAIEGAE